MATGAFYNPLIPSVIIDRGLIAGAFAFGVDTSLASFNALAGTPNPDQYKLPLVSTGTYNFVVHWGDGTTDTITTWNQAETTHTYAQPGEYLVQLVGTVTGILVGGEGNVNGNKMFAIYQWGTGLTLTNVNGTFDSFGYTASRLNVYAQDVPNLSGNACSRLFTQCRNMSGAGANWNWPIKGTVGLEVGGMFHNTQFQGDVSMWDTSDCTRFMHNGNENGGLFDGTPFNSDVSTKVIDPGGPNEYTAWDVSNVTQFGRTFKSTSKFNQDLGSWDVSSGTGDFRGHGEMFLFAAAFNNGGSDSIKNWDMSNATDLQFMFGFTTVFNQPIGDWDTSNVKNMFAMFFGAAAFNQPLGTWDTSEVTNMVNMFLNAPAFNQDIGSWNVGKVTGFDNFMGGKTPSTFSAANLSAIYNGWIVYELQTARSITFGTAKYTSGGVEGRALLSRTNSTVNVDTITDDSGAVKVTTVSAHGLSTGNKIFIKNVVGTTEANGLHIVTVIDTTNFTLDSVVFTNAYVSGGNVRTGYGWTITDGGEE